MIFRAPDGQRFEAVCIRNAAQIGPEPLSNFGRNRFPSLFCREYAVNKFGNVGV